MQIRNGQFLLGNCLEIMPTLAAGSVDMVLCDLPYGTTACAWDIVIPFEPLWREIWRLLPERGPAVLTASQPFTTQLIASQIEHYKATWYWQKERGTNFVQAKRYPMRVIEDCCLFARKTPFYDPIMRDVKPYNHVLPKPKAGSSQHMNSKSENADGSRKYKKYDKAYPINVLPIPRDNMQKGKSLHPTQKPVALFEYLIRTYTEPGAVVLDMTAGSGTTAIAAERTGRRWICIERDEDYYWQAVARVLGGDV